MRIFKTAIFFEGNQGEIFNADTIFYEGKYWLVPSWLYWRSQAQQMPERIICLDGLPLEKTRLMTCDFRLNAAIPKALFDLEAPPQSISGYIVVDSPEVVFPIGNA